MRNGWRARLEFRPRGTSGSYNQETNWGDSLWIQIPPEIIFSDIKIKSGWETLPYGVIPAKSMTLKVNLELLLDLADEEDAREAGAESYNLRTLHYYITNPLIINNTLFRIDYHDLNCNGQFALENTYIYNTWCLYTDRGKTSLTYPSETFVHGTSGAYHNNFFPEGIFIQTYSIEQTVNLTKKSEPVTFTLQDSIVWAFNAIKHTDIYNSLDPYYTKKHYHAAPKVTDGWQPLPCVLDFIQTNSDKRDFERNGDYAKARFSDLFAWSTTLDHFYERLFELSYKMWCNYCIHDTAFYKDYDSGMKGIFADHPMYRHNFFTQAVTDHTSEKGNSLIWDISNPNNCLRTDHNTRIIFKVDNKYLDTTNYIINDFPGGLLSGGNDNYDEDSFCKTYQNSVFSFLTDNTAQSGFYFQLKYINESGLISWNFKPNSLGSISPVFTIDNLNITPKTLLKQFSILKSVNASQPGMSGECIAEIVNPNKVNENPSLKEEINIQGITFITSPTARCDGKENYSDSHRMTYSNKIAIRKLYYSHNNNELARVFDDVILENVEWDGAYWKESSNQVNGLLQSVFSYPMTTTFQEYQAIIKEQQKLSGYGRALVLLLFDKFTKGNQFALEGSCDFDSALGDSTSFLESLMPNECGIKGEMDWAKKDDGITKILPKRHGLEYTSGGVAYSLDNFILTSSEADFNKCTVEFKLFFPGKANA